MPTLQEAAPLARVAGSSAQNERTEHRSEPLSAACLPKREVMLAVRRTASENDKVGDVMKAPTSSSVCSMPGTRLTNAEISGCTTDMDSWCAAARNAASSSQAALRLEGSDASETTCVRSRRMILRVNLLAALDVRKPTGSRAAT